MSLKLLVRFIYFVMVLHLNSSFLNCQVLKTEINKDWKFKQVRGVNWYTATVPGVVHTDLIDNKIIEDPFLRLNERACQWVDKEDWEYKTSFDVSDEMFAKDNLRLVFRGLDTYADIYLNDEKVLSTDNMFREWHVDCKVKLKKQGNVLRIYFHSLIKIDLPKYEALSYHYPSSNDQSENGGLLDKHVSNFARKAPYHYGWDWGPRLVTSGIWRPIFLEAWNNARIEDVQVFQTDVTAASANVKFQLEVSSDKDQKCKLTVVNAKDNSTYVTIPATLGKGSNVISASFILKKPQLWWTNGLGEQYLYPFKAILKTDNKESDSQILNIGIRSLKLVLNNPDGSKTFHFELNGVPVFMKGANYIPSDNFLTRVSAQKYEKIILDARNANMNMLRVWGGGIYENDIFYDLCDKYGILLWHDFMFACSMYPADSAMLDNIKQEAIQNVKRIRNHACLAVWCGNNEMNFAWFDWGWKDQFEKQSKELADKVWAEYQNIFNKTLPEVVKEFDPQTAYRVSSPIEINGSGDMHYWGVWHAKEPFENYAKVIPQFMSEYGFQSFPELKSVKRYATEPSDWDIYSEVMLLHQRHPRGNQLIKAYLEMDYRMPKDFESFLYMSHVVQAEGIKIGEEAHRRNMPKCMGSIYWQLDDCWPVASWSSVDYYGNWKALQYYTKRAFTPILVSPFEENDKLSICVVSDKLTDTKAKLDVKVLDFNGAIVNEYSLNVTIPANTCKVFLSEDISKLLKGKQKNEVVVYATVSDKEGTLSANTYYLTKAKDINFPMVNISKTFQAVDGGIEVVLKADKFARCTYLKLDDTDSFISDNYFDLIPDTDKKIAIKTKLSISELEKRLEVKSIVDSY